LGRLQQGRGRKRFGGEKIDRVDSKVFVVGEDSNGEGVKASVQLFFGGSGASNRWWEGDPGPKEERRKLAARQILGKENDQEN